MFLTNWLSSLRSRFLSSGKARRRPVRRSPLGSLSAETLEPRVVLTSNVAPVVGVVAVTVNYTENDDPVKLDTSATVDDSDSADFSTGTLTIALTANGESGDRLAINNVGTAAGEINTSGANVRSGTTVIGTFVGGTGTTNLVITFNANSTPAIAETLLRNITYASVSDNPGTSDRTVTITLTDGDGGTSTAKTKTVNIIAQNDAPVIADFDTAVSYTEGNAAAILDSNATITDADSIDFSGGQLRARITDNGDSNDVLSIGHQGTDAGEIGVSGNTVSFAGTQIGTFSGGTGTTTLTINLNASATVSAVQALLRRLNYVSNATNPSTDPKTVEVTVSDGDGLTSTAVTKTITITAVNTAPAIGVSGFSGTYVENSVNPAIIDSSATLSDDDSADFEDGTLTATITANGTANDLLSIKHTGTSAGQVGVSGSDVSYGGVTIGTFAGGTGTTPLVVTFNEDSTPVSVRAVMRAVQFSTSSDAPGASRTISFVVDDGGLVNSESNTVTKTVNITEVNDAPILGAFTPDITYTEGGGTVLVDSDATLSDVDSADLDGGNLTARISTGGHADDRLTIRNIGTDAGEIGVSGETISFAGVAIGTFTGGTGTTSLIVSLNSSATPTAVQALLRALEYESVSQNPTGTRIVRVTATDDHNSLSSAVEKTITVVGINSAPTITPSISDASYTEDGTPGLLDSAATVSDPDSANFNGGTLTASITANEDDGDVLSIRNQGTSAGQISWAVNGDDEVEVSFGGVLIGIATGGTDGDDLVITFTSNSASVAAVQALIRNLVFSTTSDDPSTAARTISLTVVDGDGHVGNAQDTSATVTKTLNVTPHNDAPTVFNFSGTLSYTEGDIATLIDTDAVVIDPDSVDLDGGTMTISYTVGGEATDILGIGVQGDDPGEINGDGTNVFFGGVNIGTAAGGIGTSPLVITFNSNATPAAATALLNRITYNTLSDNPATSKTVRVLVNDGDGGISSAVTKDISITLMNTAPTIAMPGPTVNWTEAGGAVVLDSSATATDPDSANFATGTIVVTITTNASADDRLTVRHVGTSTNQIGVSGANISFQGTTIGTMAGGSGTTALTITLNVNATPTAVQILLRNIVFNNVSSDPSTAQRTISVVLTDGDDGTSNTVTKDVTITEVNTNITIGSFTDDLAYDEGDAATLIDADATITDPDSADLNKGKLTVRTATGGETTDILEIRNEGTDDEEVGVSGKNVTYGGVTIGKWTGGTGFNPLVITFNAASTPSAAQAVLRNITYRSTSGNPLTAKTITAQISDGDGTTSSLVTKTVNITTTNSAPTIANLGSAAKYKKGKPAMILSSAAQVTDSDSADLSTGVLTIAISANVDADDRLEIKNNGTKKGKIGIDGSNITYGGTVIGTFAGGEGEDALVITLNANATPAIVQALVRNITFRSLSATPPTGDRTIGFTLSDGDGATSTTANKTVTIL